MKPILSITVAVMFLTMMFNACKDEEPPTVVDCTSVTGATFSSNMGKMQEILTTKCSGSSCHSPGGAGSAHWFNTDYDSMYDHFNHMYEAVILEKEMPPSSSVKLTDDELKVFKCWKQAGFPK